MNITASLDIESTPQYASGPQYIYWNRAIPHFGFTYDRVLAIAHWPSDPRFTARLRNYARRPGICNNQTIHRLADYFGDPERFRPNVRSDFQKVMSALLTPVNLAAAPFELLFKKIREDYGHVFEIIRHNGIPVKIYGNMRCVGFYPHYLSQDIVDRRMVYRDNTLSKTNRNAMMAKYDTLVPGDLSDDSDRHITSCVVIKLSASAYHDAPHAVRQSAANQGYHSFGEKGPNCAVIGRRNSSLLRSPVPDEFSDKMPYIWAGAIEKYAAEQKAGSCKIPTSSMVFVSREDMRKANVNLLTWRPPAPDESIERRSLRNVRLAPRLMQPAV